MVVLFYYLGRLLQLSGLALGGLVIFLFFDPANGEAKLLLMTVVSAAIFLAGHVLLINSGRSAP